MILAGPDGDQARRFGIVHQAHGFPGHTESAFHLRTDGPVRHVFSQGVRKKTIMLVAAVITDILTKQAGTDADRDFFHFYFIRSIFVRTTFADTLGAFARCHAVYCSA